MAHRRRLLRRRAMRTVVGALAPALVLQACAAPAPPNSVDRPVVRTTSSAAARLVARAVLLAETYADGPTSGAHLGDAKLHGVAAPFAHKQPVMGFSGLVALADGSYLAPTDNGFGTFERSSDFELRVYTLTPDFDAPGAGAAPLRVTTFLTLRDPKRLVPFAIVNQFSADRALTGADFDIESLQRAPDGTLWLGDEFGPFVLHVSATGELLDAPIALPDFGSPPRDGERDDIWSPEHPAADRTGALRVMNAFRAEAERGGDALPLVVSPSEALVKRGVVDIGLFRAAGYSVVPYTVDDPAAVADFVARGVAGVITDRPDVVRPLAPHIDVEGHRGARGLRPENTLPAMEAALDAGASTLETDIGLTEDGIPVLSHDSVVSPLACRPTGQGRGLVTGLAIHALSRAALQAGFLCDKTPRGAPQSNDLAASPVAASFARAGAGSIAAPYTMPTLAQLFAFVVAYRAYYATGPGRAHAEAARRVHAAETVRYSLETKVVAGSDPSPEAFAAIVTRAVDAAGVARRTSLQSFDFRALRRSGAPAVTKAFLFGEPLLETGRPELAGVPWPHAKAGAAHPLRAARSGGFEGMAISPDGRTLYPMLEHALQGEDPARLPIYELDVATKRITKLRAYYRLSPEATSASDFVLVSPARGLVLERDASEGAASVDGHGWKRIYEIELRGDGEEVRKSLFVDLMDIAIAPHAERAVAATFADDIGLAPRFQMPFETIEGVAFLGGARIAVINDNNFPFSIGRHARRGVPDDTELVVLDGARALDTR